MKVSGNKNMTAYILAMYNFIIESENIKQV